MIEENLQAFISRIENLEADKKVVSDDIKDVYLELKSQGFVPKHVRSIVKLRKKDAAERQEEETIIELYKSAIGME